MRIFLLSFLFISLAFSAVQEVPTTGQLRQHLNSQKKQLASISKEIYSIEKNLGQGNKRYLKTLKERERLENLIYSLEGRLQADEDLASEKKKSVERELKNFMVVQFSQNAKPENLLLLKYMKQNLKKESAILNSFMKENSSIRKKLAQVKNLLKDTMQTESDLLGLMKEMEESKRVKSLTYMDLEKKKSELQVKLKLSKVEKVKLNETKKIVQVANIKERFSGPLDSIVDMEYGKKGVTYKFDKRQSVRTSRAGKVIHTGSLSTYGNVVMVDHGNDVKSIFLGQFLPSVKKGQKVEVGASLGKTFDVAKNEGKLYFEVRKKNMAQNTILLIDKNITTENNQGRQRI